MIRGRLRRALKARLERLMRRRETVSARWHQTNQVVRAIEALLATQERRAAP